MKNREMLYEGKAKVIFKSDKENEVIVCYYKDDATAFNGEKKGSIEEKGILNNNITCLIFDMLRKKWDKNTFNKEAQ